jgi:hypothetical protein
MASTARVAIGRHSEWLWAPLLYVLAVVWLYRDLWHQHGVATGLGWDTIDSYGPDLEFFARELAHGRFSLWNPYDKGGYPVFCDPQIDRYYPFGWPFAAWGAVFGVSWWLVQIKMLAHQVVAACTMHLFLRTRGLSTRASVVGGFGLIAATPILAHKASILLWPLVWVPLVWVAIDAAVARPTWRRGVALAGAMTLPATAASPPGLWYAMFLIAPYAVWRMVVAVRARTSRSELYALGRCAAVAAGVLALVFALVFVPARELAALGSRDRFGGDSPDFATLGGLSPAGTVVGLFIRGVGLPEVYMGIAMMMLAACALVTRRRSDHHIAILLASVAAAALVLAAGDASPVLPWLAAHVPGFSLWRVPGRYKLVAVWVLAACAGYGIAALEAGRGDPRARRRVFALAAALALVTAVAVIAWGQPATFKDRPAWWSLVATAVAGVLVCAAIWSERLVGRAALVLLALCVLSDAPMFTFVNPSAPPAAEARRTHARDDELVARISGASDRWRVYDEFVLGERAGARLGIRDFRGYPAIDPLSIHRYVDVLDFAKQHDPAIVTDFNVRWLFLHPHFRYASDATYVRATSSELEPRGADLWEARHPAPLVAWYGAAQLVDHASDVLAAVRAVEETDGSRRRVVMEQADATRMPPIEVAMLVAGPPDSREGTVEDYSPDEIRVAVDAPRAGVVVLDEIEFPGWNVEVDGVPAPELRANYLLRAAWVDGGHHELVWRFSPPHWRVLLVGYALALAIMCGTWFSTLVARRRRARQSRRQVAAASP